jgi:mono/diheme cytochrome c family protein
MQRQRSWVLISLLGGLAGCAPAEPPVARAGADLYNGNCSGCHQAGGQGITGVYPSLAGSPTVLGDPAALARWIVKGERASTMPRGRYATAMPQFGWLKDADTAALLTYLRRSFGNQAPPVVESTVARALEQ